MISSYKAGYYTGRAFTKVVKYYLTGKVFKKTLKKVDKIAKEHSIDSRNSAAVTENIFDCLDY